MLWKALCLCAMSSLPPLGIGDCAELIRKAITTNKIPGNFVIVNGVSDNKGRVHDISNPLGWFPKEGGWYPEKNN